MKARIIFLALLLLCLNVSNTFAKPNVNTIKGIVTDSNTNEHLEFATAILENTETKDILQTTMTGQKGEFSLKNIADGNYNLRISFVGYKDYETKVELSEAKKEVDLSTIKMEAANTQLAAAVITSRAPTIERKMDMLVMNLEQSVSAAGETALDILKKAPGVTIDKDDNVKLLGGSVLVQLDGRETRLSGAELADLLKSLDGNEISKIEIINSPSAKQDASGGSGIINIRTKKSKLRGFNGTVNLGTQVYRNFGYNGGISLNYRHDWFGAYGSFNHNKHKWESNLIQKRHGEILHNGAMPDTTSDFYSNADANMNGNRNNYRAGIDFYINKNNTLGFLVTGNTNNGEEKTKSFSNLTINDTVTENSWANYKNKNDDNGVTFNTNYKSVFGEGHDLTIDLDYAKFNYKPVADQIDYTIYPVKGTDITETHLVRTPRNVEVHSAKADYKRSLGEKTKMETGAKISNSKTENSSVWNTLTNNNWEIDPDRTNDFEYTERVTAAYVSLGHEFSSKFSVKAGLRWENTYSKSYSPTTDSVTKRHYDDFFPTFFTQYKPSEKHDFTLSYNRRINRPGYWSLNPFRYYTDKRSYITGNPFLTPEYSHNINLSHNLNNKLITTLMYRHSKDMIVQAAEQEEGSSNSGMIRINFGYAEMAGISITIPNFNITKWWAVSANLWAAWNHNHAMEKGKAYDDYSIGSQFNLTNNITFAKTWKIEQGNYLSGPGSWGYMKMETQYWSNIGVKKSFMDGKLNASVNVDDPFGLSRFEGRIKNGHIDNYYREKSKLPNVRFNLSWRFGSTKINTPGERKGGNADELNRMN